MQALNFILQKLKYKVASIKDDTCQTSHQFFSLSISMSTPVTHFAQGSEEDRRCRNLAAQNNKKVKNLKKKKTKKRADTATLSDKGHCLLNTLNWLFPWANFTSIHLDASIDTRMIMDPFSKYILFNPRDYTYNVHLPMNSTGGNGGWYIHTLTALFQRDGRFPANNIDNILSEIWVHDPVELIKQVGGDAVNIGDKFLFAGMHY
jgi:hypothetical protein